MEHKKSPNLDKIDTTDQFYKFINSVMQLDDAKSKRILEFVHYEHLPKNTVLVHQGEICRKFYYIVSGGIRIYFCTPKGQEKTRLVLFENSPFTALFSFITSHPSVESIEVLEDSLFAVIKRNDFFSLIDEMPEWATFYRKVLEKAYVYQNTRLEQLTTLSAKERYQIVLNEYPHFIQRLSNRILASYLDITQETLSRLKSR